jgi:hypothetical protein
LADPAVAMSNQNVFTPVPTTLKAITAGPAASSLTAITINGAIHVESDEDRKKKEERRKNRKSR